MIRLLCLGLLLLLLGSCSKNNHVISQQSKKNWQTKNNRLPIDVVQQQEAMLVDIPIPLYDERLPAYDPDADSKNNTIMLGYKTSLTVDNVIEFYTQQMERLGWNHVKLFKGSESLLQFESPDRLCTISVRPRLKRSSGTNIFIFIGAKEDVLF